MEKDCSTKISITDFSNNLQKSIQVVINNLGYVEYEADVKKISTDGNNFLGELFEIDVFGRTSDGIETTHIFLKRIIRNEDFRVYSIPEVYKKEAFVYNELSNIYNELQNKVTIPMNEKFKFIKNYGTNDEAIILENVSKQGFKTMERMDIMTKDFAELSIKQLAKFHGLSLALEWYDRDYFNEKVKTIKQSFIYDDYWNEFVKRMYDLSTSKLELKIKKRTDEFFLNSLQKYPKYMNGINSDIKCLCHGDYKMNNVLFREAEGKITEVIPIDYQQIYYGCPVIDLIYFIYAASDRSFRKQHLNYLKDVYFGSLTMFLNYFGIDVATVYPREVFESSFSNSLDYALMYTLYMLPFFYVKEQAPDLSQDELLDVTISVDDKFYNVMNEIVEEFVEYGII
ncbi:unnamed protein product [Danaus chrysippus]|uniref:(African queen) hypothetical protein n=1 Tax=Danaus chrysippus TaxID=151541 RepID=A0A8J2QK97_9NEOP|nr:unnamed protein product [Danaus chrysippus]